LIGYFADSGRAAFAPSLKWICEESIVDPRPPGRSTSVPVHDAWPPLVVPPPRAAPPDLIRRGTASVAGRRMPMPPCHWGYGMVHEATVSKSKTKMLHRGRVQGDTSAYTSYWCCTLSCMLNHALARRRTTPPPSSPPSMGPAEGPPDLGSRGERTVPPTGVTMYVVHQSVSLSRAYRACLVLRGVRWENQRPCDISLSGLGRSWVG
jgi:hypothetical protein